MKNKHIFAENPITEILYQMMKKLKLAPCEEGKFPDIPGMDFYGSGEGVLYFDAAKYLAGQNAGEGLSVEDFFSKFDYLVDAFCRVGGITHGEMTVEDGTGVVYLDECLAVPFLMYAEPRLVPYLFQRMEEMLHYGFVIGDSLLRHLHSLRFDDNVINAPR